MSLPPQSGWFPDPGDPGQIRWWDGVQWTEHVSRTSPVILAPPPAPVAAPLRRRRTGWPWWAWALVIVAVVATFIFASPVVTIAALVVLITAIVAVARNKPTWLRFRNRGVSIAAIGVSAVVMFTSANLSSALYPREVSEPVAVVASPSAMPTTTPSPRAAVDRTDPIDKISTLPFGGTITTASDSGATDGLTALAVLESLQGARVSGELCTRQVWAALARR